MLTYATYFNKKLRWRWIQVHPTELFRVGHNRGVNPLLKGSFHVHEPTRQRGNIYEISFRGRMGQDVWLVRQRIWWKLSWFCLSVGPPNCDDGLLLASTSFILKGKITLLFFLGSVVLWPRPYDITDLSLSPSNFSIRGWPSSPGSNSQTPIHFTPFNSFSLMQRDSGGDIAYTTNNDEIYNTTWHLSHSISFSTYNIREYK